MKRARGSQDKSPGATKRTLRSISSSYSTKSRELSSHPPAETGRHRLKYSSISSYSHDARSTLSGDNDLQVFEAPERGFEVNAQCGHYSNALIRGRSSDGGTDVVGQKRQGECSRWKVWQRTAGGITGRKSECG